MKLSITAFALFALQGAAFAQSNSKCADMAKFKSPGVTLEISRAANIPEGRVIGARVEALRDRFCRLTAALME